MLRHLLVAALVAAAVSAFPADEITSLPDYGPLLSKQYAGYLPPDAKGRKAFYWLTESQRNASTDPLVLWLTGGPGCSSLMAFTEENGPYLMRQGGRFMRNEYSWDTIANVLYIESPAGVGFSQDVPHGSKWDDAETAAFNYHALRGFLKKFPQFVGRRLVLTGESYAGFYVPQLAEAILDGPDATLRGMVSGLALGNPCTGSIGCWNSDPTLHPFMQYNGFASFRSDVKADSKAQFDPYDLLEPSCAADFTAQVAQFSHPILNSYRRKKERRFAHLAARQGVSVHSPRAVLPYGPCADNHVNTWFNRPDVKAAVHADPSVTWQSCSMTVVYNYTQNTVGVVATYKRLMKETAWDLMIYSGLSDSIVPHPQTQLILNKEMGLTPASDVFKAWYLPYWYNTTQTQLGGFFQLYDRFAWAGVRNAGHMVPQYNPPAGLEIFRSFMETGKPGRLSD